MRDLRDIDLNLLLVFEAVFKTGSVSQAARMLNLSQPTVSNALYRLRGQFSDRLFVRSESGMRPTPMALSLVASITQALGTLRSGLQIEADFDVRTANRHFKLILHDFSVPSILPPLLRLLDQPEGSCTLEVITPDWTQPHSNLAQGEADLMLDVFPQETPGVVFEPVADAEAVCIVREGHPDIGTKLTQENFEACGHAILQSQIRRRLQVPHMLMAESLKRREVCVLPNAADLAATVAVSDMIAIVPRRYAMMVAPIYRLRVLAPPFDYPKTKIFLAWSEEKANDPGVSWIKNVVRSIFET
ncbi:LysR family transcriptional regulator [Fulvimarina endophytica]|uniref:LysR family transcriptional regulator n=1 Tax=Fulvimarina endophytica TaxID=2293836 RepID=A0A371WXZ1_9HYPH|nr:LysR family transcriptional regulator [Fulvimarina endophytica]RFC61870.1 LysR family transcriptional regulator [Fulvimarina endophytica]